METHLHVIQSTGSSISLHTIFGYEQSRCFLHTLGYFHCLCTVSLTTCWHFPLQGLAWNRNVLHMYKPSPHVYAWQEQCADAATVAGSQWAHMLTLKLGGCFTVCHHCRGCTSWWLKHWKRDAWRIVFYDFNAKKKKKIIQGRLMYKQCCRFSPGCCKQAVFSIKLIYSSGFFFKALRCLECCIWLLIIFLASLCWKCTIK